MPGIAFLDALAVWRVEDVAVRRHRGAVQPRHEGPVHVLRRAAALQASLREVERLLRVSPGVGGQGASGGTVTEAGLAVTGGALEETVDLAAARDRLGGAEARRCRGNRHDRTG